VFGPGVLPSELGVAIPHVAAGICLLVAVGRMQWAGWIAVAVAGYWAWQWAIGSMQLWGMNGEMPTATAGTLLALLAAVEVVGFVAAFVASIPEPSYG
jgi:hypothetical protein